MALMTSMRNRMHVVLWALLILFLLSMTVGGLVGGANIIDTIFGKVDPQKAIGMINGQQIAPEYFSERVSQQLDQARQSGQELTEQQFLAARNEVWNNLVQEMLVQQEIERLKIRTTDEEVIFQLQNNPPQFLQSNPTFQTNGVFDAEKYDQAVRSPQGNEWAPIEQFMKTTYLPNYKLQQMVVSSVSVNTAELREEYIKRNVNFTINAMHITQRSLSQADLDVPDEVLQKEYKKRIVEFNRPERRRVLFASWQKAASRSDSLTVFQDASRLIDRIKAGESFATIANQYSQDPGNQVTPDSARGGVLGWFGKGQMVKPFEDAAFAARKGSVVGPVLSRFGYHIIKIMDRRNNNGKEEIHAAHILLTIEMGPQTRDDLRQQAKLFSYDGQDYGFAAAVDTHSVAIDTSQFFDADAQFLPGLGNIRSAIRFAFDGALGDVSDPQENDNYFVVVMIDSILAPGPAAFEEVKPLIKRDVVKKITQEKTLAIAGDYYQQILAGKSIEDLLKTETNVEKALNDTKVLNRGFSSIGRSSFAIGALLKAKPGDVIGPIETARGHAILELLSVAKFDTADFSIKKDLLERELLTAKQNQVFKDWMDELKSKAEIVDNRKYYF